MGSCSWTVKLDTGFYQSVLHSSFFKMKAFLLLSITLTVISGQQERSEYRHKRSPQDDGQYVHDTTGDFGPYYYYKLRKQAEAAAAKGKTLTEVDRSAAPAIAAAPTQAPAPAPVRAKPQPAAPARFANLRAIPATPAPAPVRQPQRFRAPAPAPRQQPLFAPQQPAAAPVNTDPHYAPPGGLRFQFQIAAPEFSYQNNFAKNAYSFSSPLYSTNAQGGSYSYAAIY